MNIIELDRWLGACWTLSHYTNQPWLIVNDHDDNFNINVIEFPKLSFKEMRLKCRLQNCGHFVLASVCWSLFLNDSILTTRLSSKGANLRQWIGSALVQIIACRLFGTKPLSKPMLGYCRLDPQKQTSVKFESKYKTFRSQKAFENVVCEKAAILSKGDELNPRLTVSDCYWSAWYNNHLPVIFLLVPLCL